MLDFLLFLPVLLLLLGALGIVIQQQMRPSIGYAWLIAALAGLAASAAALALRWQIPLEQVIEWWRPFADYSSPAAFRLDDRSWPYVFCLALVSWAFILTDAARLETEARPYNWALGLALTGLGMTAVMAANPITLVVIWTAVDMVEFMMVMTTQAGRQMSAQTVTLFSVRVAGTLLVILAMLLARAQGVIPFQLNPIPPELALLMLLAAGLRLGVLPLNLPYIREVYSLRGLGNVMRMIGPASSMIVLGRMPEQAVPPEWKGLFLFLSALAAVYGGAMFLAADNELNARPFWFTALAALGVASVTNGSPLSSIAWGMVLILPGSLLFFYSARRPGILYLPLLGMLGITGLPFTPAAAGWAGVTGGSAGGFGFLFLLSVLFLIWGYLRHVFTGRREQLYRLERWVHTIYPGGLLFLVAGHWATAFLGWPGSFTAGVWWASAAVTLLAALGVVLVYSFRDFWLVDTTPEAADSLPGGDPAAAGEAQPAAINNAALAQRSLAIPVIDSLARYNDAPVEDTRLAVRRWMEMFARRVGSALAGFFRLNWLYRFIAWIYQIVQNVIHTLTLIFEGDGGILWSLVMLALLISLFWSGAAW